MKAAKFKTLDWLTVTFIPRILANVLAIILLAIIILVSVQIVARSVFASPIDGLEELVRYLFVWSIFLGAGLATARKLHLSAGISFMGRLPVALRPILILAVSIGLLFSMLAFAWHGFTLLELNNENFSPSLRLPMMFVWLCVPIGGLLVTYYLGVSLFKKVVEWHRIHRPDSGNQDDKPSNDTVHL